MGDIQEDKAIAGEQVDQEGQMPVSEATKTPLLAPTADSKPLPRADLTEEQQTKYDSLLEKAQEISEVKCSKKFEQKTGPVTDRERAWLTRECLLRYLRATKWNVAPSLDRLLATLAWRRECGIEDFTAEYIAPEQVTGKQIIFGFDRQGRPCHYLNPGRENMDPSPRQIHHLFYMVERVVELMPPGVETLSLLINHKPSKQRQNTTVPVSMAKEVLHILQNHYPERLGKALIINVPWLVQGFFKIINPFMDPVTREKLKFNEDMTQYVPPSQLWSSDWGGDLDFDYEHDTYWPALNDLCRRKREERMARWEAAGSRVGESEEYLTGGTDVSVGGVEFVAGGGDKEKEKEKEKMEENADSSVTTAVEKTEGNADDGVMAVEEKMALAKLEEEAKVDTA